MKKYDIEDMKRDLNKDGIILIGLFLIGAILITQKVTFYEITIWRFLSSIAVILGFFILGKLCWMTFYEYKFGQGAGEAYIKGELKEYLEDMEDDEIDFEEIEAKIKHE